MGSPEHFPSNDEMPQEHGAAEGEQELAELAREVSESDRGIVNKIRKGINSKVQESRLPNKEGWGYESTVGVYGGKLVKDEEGRLVYDTRGFWSKIDQWGDRVLRAFDEHHARRPGAMFARRPGAFMKLLPFIVDSKRYRGTPDQAAENVRRFGLEQYYGRHPWGIEIKDPKLFSRLVGLQDVFRQDQIDHPEINKVDRFQALGAAANYMASLHRTAGGIAEGNVYSFLFTKKEDDGKVEDPIIMIPTEIYNPEKHISEVEKKATDLLDLLTSSATEEHRRSGDWENIKKCLDTVLEHYGDPKVIAMAESYAKRGRLTLAGDAGGQDPKQATTGYKILHKAFSAHNTQRLAVKTPAITAQIRDEIAEACARYVETAKSDAATEPALPDSREIPS